MKGYSRRFDFVRERAAKINMVKVIDRVAELLGISYNDVVGNSRKRKVSDARKISVKIVIDIMNFDNKSYFKYGHTLLGILMNKAHPDVIYNYRKCEDLISSSKDFREKYNKCLFLQQEFIDLIK